jgi:GDPmannose 4,6-dehydratase
MSPYGVSKAASQYLVVNYRKAYGIRGTTGTLFNHESELRGREFVTRKITSKLAEIVMGSDKPVVLGNLNAVRDWGYAPDYVESMKLIAQASTPDDFVIATNTVITVRDFFKAAAEELGFSPEFQGEGIDEICVDRKTGKTICQVSSDFYRPSDVNFLRGSYSKAHSVLGWKPTVYGEDVARIMANFDLKLASGEIAGNFFW